jgi:serine/threonine-protein kinase RsbW
VAKDKARVDEQKLSTEAQQPMAEVPVVPDMAPDSLVPDSLAADFPPSGPSTGSWHLILPGVPDSLPDIRDMIDEAAARCGFAGEEVAKIEMAVDEACTNIIEHAYKSLQGHGESKPEIEVRAQGFQDRLEITILDRSLHNFPIHEHSGIDADHYLAEQRRRGLGLFIIRSFVDDVQHRFINGQGNELLLVKYFA